MGGINTHNPLILKFLKVQIPKVVYKQFLFFVNVGPIKISLM
jgi:hypothetical protein